jgi:hypothetical protein
MAYVNTIPNFKDSLDLEKVKLVQNFFKQVNDRLLYKMGELDHYDDKGDEALRIGC